jgi:23S rRNA (uracil1939-C5)-methyltransferase
MSTLVPGAPDASQLTCQDVRAGQPLEITIEGYGHTGEGFARLKDGWVSVRNALPGERVRVVVEPGQSPYTRRLFASLLDVLVPSEARRDPLCARTLICRGCHLRAMHMTEELRWKCGVIAEVIARYAELPLDQQPPVQPIAPEGLTRADAERIRAALTYRRADDGPQLGLVAAGGAGLIPMVDCPALTAPVRRLIGQLEAALQAAHRAGYTMEDRASWRKAGAPGGLVLVRVAAPGHGHGMIVLELECDAADPLWEPLTGLLAVLDAELPAHVGLFIEQDQQVQHVRGPARLRLPLAGMRLEVGPQEWFHATLRPAEALYAEVGRLLAPAPNERMLDLGCGIGTLSLHFAPQLEHVVGVDQMLPSVARAGELARELGRTNASFMAGAWEGAGRRLMAAGQRFALATINPMREPVGERALAYLGQLGVQRAVYLGPSPVSAAKDIGAMLRAGWRLDYLGAANLHPATYHVMLVARLRWSR